MLLHRIHSFPQTLGNFHHDEHELPPYDFRWLALSEPRIEGAQPVVPTKLVEIRLEWRGKRISRRDRLRRSPRAILRGGCPSESFGSRNKTSCRA